MSTPPGADAEPSEQELRAAYEQELSRITSADVMLQAAVSLLNIGGMRLGLGQAPGAEPGPERDLEQVREAIDGVRALLPILERKAPQELRPLRDALSQLQMAFARETGAAPGAAAAAAAAGGTPVVSEPGAPSTGAPSTGAPPAGAAPSSPAAEPASPAPATGETPPDPAAGPAVSSGRLWVPGR